MSEEHQWELVTKGIYEFTDRLRVPNGWLYRTVVNPDGASPVAMCFVPDVASIMATVNAVTRRAPVFVKDA